MNRISEENKREMAMAVRAEGRDPVGERLAMLAGIKERQPLDPAGERGDYVREQDAAALRVMRGMVNGLLLSIVIWAGLAFLVAIVLRLAQY